ncbi:MAG: 4-hydroxyphenylacetate 3-hydroxylase family protein [Syntrophomonadaceae bacterium]|nr:4-hydroxyphenylacetate 3-hydroxylase family protein [Syntrophomonadaceae bacterium]
MKTGQEYIESLKQLKTEIYFMGERIESLIDSPHIKPHINTAALTYDIAFEPETMELATATSSLTGKKINRFTHLQQNTDDLVKKSKLLRAIGQKTGTCFQRCVGWDAMNAVYSVSYEIDQKYGTSYQEKVIEYVKYIQENDLMVVGGMTDPKGDRSLPPHKQADPDVFVHIVEKRDDGIIVRGAKAHQTGAANSHEILVMPTVSMKPEDKDFAVSFATPLDAPGIVLIFGRQTNDERKLGKLDQGNPTYGVVGGEALIIFNDVFIPWERVFMCGETEFAGMLVERFATYHRQNYGACKAGVIDVLIGATATIADYNGTAKASAIKDKMIEMVLLNETLHASSLAAGYEGHALPAGNYYPQATYANITKQNITRNHYEICRLAHDITGGFIATLPSEKDLAHPVLGPMVLKYFKAISAVDTMDRIKIGRLIENVTGGTALVESMHGAGSPQAQRVVLLRDANLEKKKKLAQNICGIIPQD